MEVDQLIAVLDGDGDLMSVVGSLGRDCVDRHDTVKQDQDAAVADMIVKLRELAAEESTTMWSYDGVRSAGPSAELKERVTKAGMTPELATITALEGICSGAARLFFAHASSVVRVERGSALPLPERWLADIPTTPRPATMHGNLLNDRCNFVLWHLDWVIELDYTFRDRLDLVCAVRLTARDKVDAEGRPTRLAYALPKIATVHPFEGAEMGGPDLCDEERKRFFGVRPKLPSDDPKGADKSSLSQADALSREEAHQKVFDALAKAGEVAPIAVLPEFCLHSADGLDTFIDTSTLPLAALIVAGSAHTVDGAGKRFNTSHVFLDRQRILSVSKYQPFVLRAKPFDYVEDIAPSPRVLRLAAGTATRLGIAICADLNSFDLLTAMTWAGVNVLLSPSWTPTIGGADRGLETLAGYCQCVGVIANTPGHLLAQKGKTPFSACTDVPREEDHAHFHDCGGALPAVGVLDPNVPDTDANYWTWLR
jgi:hypothetical protein